MLAYIDDYIIVSSTASGDVHFRHLASLLAELALLSNPDPACRKLTCLGIQIDLDKNELLTQKSLRAYIMNVWQLVVSVIYPGGPFSPSWVSCYIFINVFPQPALSSTGCWPYLDRTQVPRK